MFDFMFSVIIVACSYNCIAEHALILYNKVVFQSYIIYGIEINLKVSEFRQPFSIKYSEYCCINEIYKMVKYASYFFV